jgi:hypothetical protein
MNTKAEFIAAGFDPWIAEALEESAMTMEEVKISSLSEILDKVLEWNGIVGYTSNILDAVKNLRTQMQQDKILFTDDACF